MTVYVQPGSGQIPTGTYPASYAYGISVDTALPGEPVTIATAASSPRIDYVVAYIDVGVTPTTSGTYVNNTNAVLKFASVAGTPAGSPVVPTTAQINSAIGASNPYITLAQVAVAASVTTITSANITDLRTLVTPRSYPVLSYTNSGSAGGTFYYSIENGVKKLWGMTGSLGVSGNSPGSTTYTLNFPSGFFNSVQSVIGTVTGNPANSQYLYIAPGLAPSASQWLFQLAQSGGSNGSVSSASIYVVGT